MNIVCNNCVGARLYEVNHIQFNNPFTWCVIKTNDFIKLIKDFDKHNFNNAKFELENYYDKPYKSILVTIDDDIRLHYIHYIYDENASIPYKRNNTDILYKNILEYSYEKFHKRLKRMSFDNIKFLYSFNYMKYDDRNYYNILKSLDETHVKLLCLVHENAEYESDNIEIIRCSNDIMGLNGTLLAKALTDKYLKKFL